MSPSIICLVIHHIMIKTSILQMFNHSKCGLHKKNSRYLHFAINMMLFNAIIYGCKISYIVVSKSTLKLKFRIRCLKREFKWSSVSTLCQKQITFFFQFLFKLIFFGLKIHLIYFFNFGKIHNKFITWSDVILNTKYETLIEGALFETILLGSMLVLHETGTCAALMMFTASILSKKNCPYDLNSIIR